MKRPATNRRERGTVLVMAAILGMLVMGLWGLAWQATHDSIRTERFVRERAERDAGVARALVRATDWLRDGPPPKSHWACIFDVGEDGAPTPCTAIYSRGMATDTWEIEVRASTPTEIRRLPPAPER